MKTIITLDRANQPYGYPQLNASGNFDNIIVSSLTATTLSATTYLNLPVTTDTFVTGFTLSSNTITLRQNRTGQYSAFTISLSAYTGSSSASGAYLPLSGGTVSGRTIFTSGITANTISATTYLNLPTDIRTTGATYSDNTFTFNSNSGGTATTFSVLFNTVTGLTANSLTVTGNTLLSGLTATTISASTISSSTLTVSATANPVKFIGLTAGTSDTRLLSVDTSGVIHTYPISGLTGSSVTSGAYLPLSGGTVTGGTIFQSGLTANTISATTYYGLPTYLSATSLSSNVFSQTTGGGSSSTVGTVIAVTGGTYSNGTITLSGTGGVNGGEITGFNNGTITGSGTSGYLSKFTGTTAIGDSGFYDNGSGTFGSYGTLVGPANAFVAVRNLAAVTTNYTGSSAGSYVRVGFNSPYTGNSTGIIEARSAGGTSASPLSLNNLGGNVIIGSLTDGGYKLDVNGTTRITNTLTVTATTDPVRFVGLSASTDSSILTVDGTGVVHTIASSSLGGGGLTWSNVVSPITATTNNGYIGTATTLSIITLPTGATFGSVIEVVGTGTGFWRVSQNASQSIKFGVATTATGTGGYLSATSQYDCVKLLCTSANTTFVVTSSIGNIFYI
jgi:hypothetical protein